MSESKGFYQAASYLGQHKNISKGILKKTACMAKEQRELIGNLEAIKTVFPLLENDIEEMDLTELIDKIVLPFAENQGLALWERDVVTDMAMKKGDTSMREQWKAHRKVTEEDRKEESEHESTGP